VTRFTERAAQILESAESAARAGQQCSDVTILVGADGGLRLIAGSDWPLESLLLEHGAISAYRVTARQGTVRVTGREGLRSCVIESTAYRRVARTLLSAPY
jgi:hypothetical protein